jgi:amphi-Trp domain-containing protein
VHRPFVAWKPRGRSGSIAAVTERDVERNCSPVEFIETLRRLADALERGETFRVQVQGRRFTVPRDAALSVEHEVDENGAEELELQLRWQRP